MKRTNWIDARESAGLTQDDVIYEVRRQLPVHYRLTKSKFSRFENGLGLLDPVVLAFLASLYGKEIVDIDTLAAEEWREVRDLVGTIPACFTVARGRSLARAS